MTTRIIFVRHGETAHNKGLVITAAAPGAPLNARGREQAAELASRLRSVDVAAIYTSPLLRARQTAEELGRARGLDPVVRIEFRECSVGELEGQGGPAAFERLDSTWEFWYHADDLDYALGPGGETGREALARFTEGVESLADAHRGRTVVVVAHGTVLQLALTRLSDNLPPSFGYRRWIDNCGTVVLDIEDDRTTCLEWSGHPPQVPAGDSAPPHQKERSSWEISE
ncbi:histidine phosphatase family protein [Streptomyces sp. NPDC059989]|uniref:histidine phosphatase family protein n=1 Tax=Streptomyces sp. NPDC059989 TaxID=3347026 RepID=UPI0036C48F4F